jgi:Rieske Fe-S protein
MAAALGAALTGEWLRDRRPAAAAALRPFRIPGAETLAPGAARPFTIPDTDVEALLVRLDVERWVAFDRRCSHLGCPVLWSPAARQFDCPCHAARFDGETGRVLAGPPPHGLRPVRVHVRDGRVWADRIERAEG